MVLALAGALGCDRQRAAPSPEPGASPHRAVGAEDIFALEVGSPVSRVHALCGPPAHDHGSGVAIYEYRLAPHGWALVACGFQNTVEHIAVAWSSDADSTMPSAWSEEAWGRLMADAERFSRQRSESASMHDPEALLRSLRTDPGALAERPPGQPVGTGEGTARYCPLRPHGFARIRPADSEADVVMDIVWWTP
jgi:hypothetical protein